MSQGNDFANYPAPDEAGAASEDVWFVAISSDDIKQMTIDQLDEAFRLGVITAQTQVWTEGMESWAPLGEVADLDGEDAEGPPAASEVEEETSIARMEYGSPAQHAAAPSYANAAGPGASGAAGGFPSGPSSFAPVTTSYAPSSFAPMPASPGAPTNLGRNDGPVALNIDEDMPPIRRGRRFRVERWLLAAAAVAGLGVTAYNNSDIFSSPAAVAENGGAAPSALASRPYEVGAGVERGAALGDSKGGEGESAEPSSGSGTSEGAAASAAAASKAPGSTASGSTASGSDSEADEAPAKKAVSGKESLKGSFSKAFKKAPRAKSRATKARKPARRARKATRAPKKASKPRAGSAFDPLNDSLP